ncbi:MAG TPA: twin-arginine translocation signal domain-containing protein [Armatimonadota bacterium]|jgi:hypothetical protein
MTNSRNPALSRRDFLQWCGAAGIVAGASLAGLPSRCAPLSQDLTLTAFAALVDSSFEFTAADAPVRMRLMSATRRPSRSQSRSVRLEVFSLIFQAPPEAKLPAAIYRVTHPRMAPFDLFISPVDLGGLRRYEAVFTRLL